MDPERRIYAVRNGAGGFTGIVIGWREFVAKTKLPTGRWRPGLRLARRYDTYEQAHFALYGRPLGAAGVGVQGQQAGLAAQQAPRRVVARVRDQTRGARALASRRRRARELRAGWRIRNRNRDQQGYDPDAQGGVEQ